ALLRPELPPQLVRDHRVIARPARLAEQLAEEHLGVAGGDRRVARLIVVAGVVEEGDPVRAGRLHHGQSVRARDALERPPRAEREARYVESGAAEGASLHRAALSSPPCRGARRWPGDREKGKSMIVECAEFSIEPGRE